MNLVLRRTGFAYTFLFITPHLLTGLEEQTNPQGHLSLWLVTDLVG